MWKPHSIDGERRLTSSIWSYLGLAITSNGLQVYGSTEGTWRQYPESGLMHIPCSSCLLDWDRRFPSNLNRFLQGLSLWYQFRIFGRFLSHQSRLSKMHRDISLVGNQFIIYIPYIIVVYQIANFLPTSLFRLCKTPPFPCNLGRCARC